MFLCGAVDLWALSFVAVSHVRTSREARLGFVLPTADNARALKPLYCYSLSPHNVEL